MIKPQPSTKLKNIQIIQINRGEFRGIFVRYIIIFYLIIEHYVNVKKSNKQTNKQIFILNKRDRLYNNNIIKKDYYYSAGTFYFIMFSHMFIEVPSIVTSPR